MRFYFLHNDKNLKAPAGQGGCGVTDQEILEVKVWQNNMSYQFEFHLENHGPYVYVFPDGRRAGQRDMPRFYFGGGRVGLFDNEESVPSAAQTDVETVVNANRALFAQMHARFYGTGGVAKKTVDTELKPAYAFYKCFNPICPGRETLVAVKFANQMVMHSVIKVSNFGGMRSSEYPSIPCPRKTCGIPMELVEFGPLKSGALVPKDPIEYK